MRNDRTPPFKFARKYCGKRIAHSADQLKNPMLIRNGRRDEIERFQAIDKAARSRYATLQGSNSPLRRPRSRRNVSAWVRSGRLRPIKPLLVSSCFNRTRDASMVWP
jgi:hypothetical protein